ncbi:MAG: DMT family transporter [Pseudomonadota bacterium]
MASLAHSFARPIVLSRPVKGILFKVASAFVFTVMVTLVKVLSERIPTGEILFARNFFALIPVFAMVAWRQEWHLAFKTNQPVAHLSRGILGVSSMFLWFGALAVLPLHDATAISYAAPLFTVALAAIVLGERVRIYRWSAVIVGFAGILLVLSPHLGTSDFDQGMGLAALACLASAVLMALTMITIRKLTETERTTTIVVYFSVLSTILSLFTIPFGWVMPSAEDAVLLVIVGLCGGAGQILLTQAYRYAEASTIAPFDYTTMIWVLLFGFIIFADVPTFPVIVGSIIVMGAGLFVIYREQVLGLDRTKARRASTPSKA